MPRTLYKRESKYAMIARNEAADLQDRISSLTTFIAEHQMLDAQLVELFQRKIDKMLELHEICEELIKFKRR